MKKRFLLLIIISSLICLGLVQAASFILYGTVQNSSYATVENANVSVYNVTMQPGQAPVRKLLASNYTNSTGGFSIAGLDDGLQTFYKIEVRYRNSTKGGNVTEISPILPELPGFDVSNSLSGAVFYLNPAATLSMRAFNATSAASGFNYIVFDDLLGFPIDEKFQGYVNNTEIYVPRNRNYTILFFKDPNFFGQDASPPVTFSLENITSYNGNDYVVPINQSLAFSDYNVYGWIWIDGNTSAANVSYFMPNMAPAGMLPEGSTVNFGENVLLTTAALQMPDATGKMSVAFYNYTVMGSAGGIEFILESYGHNFTFSDGGEFFGIYQNITITGHTTKNLTLTSMQGRYSTTQGNSYNTSRVKVNLINGDNSNSGIQDAHVEIYETLDNGFVLRHFVDTLTTSGTSSFFEKAMLASSQIVVKIFSNQFAPIEKKINTSDSTLKEVNITMKGFNMQKFEEGAGGDNVSVGNFSDKGGIGVMFMKNIAACNKPGFIDADCRIGNELDGNFNPMQAMMAGKSNLDIVLGAEAPELLFVGVDLLASGPPDAVMSENSNFDNQSGFQSLEELWKFGSLAPDIYDAVIVGIPVNASKLDPNEEIRIRLDFLYDNDWNVVWQAANDPSAANVPSDYSDYNLSWLNRTAGGMLCYDAVGIMDADQYCYINKTDEMLYLKFPHFTNLGTIVSGSVAIGDYSTIWRPLNASYATDSLTLNVTTNVSASCAYSLNGALNVTMTGNQTATYGTFFNASFTAKQGSNTIRASCNRSFTNYSIVDQNFFVDSQSPWIELNSPSNYSNASVQSLAFNWTVFDNASLSYTCNFTLDGAVNASGISAANGTSKVTVITGLANGTHQWNVTCKDALNNTNTSLTYTYFRYAGPRIYIDSPANTTYATTNLSLPFRVRVSDTSTIRYSLDGGANTTLCVNCTNNVANVSFIGFVGHRISVAATDTSGVLNVSTIYFTLDMDTDGDGTADSADADDDNDGINDIGDTLTGNVSNIDSNVGNLTLWINGSINMTDNFTSSLVINITNGTEPIVSLTRTFSNSTQLFLPNVTVDTEDATSNFGRVVIRNLVPSTGSKTLYVNRKSANQSWLCIRDSEPGVNTSVTPTCEGSGETRLPCNGTTTGVYTCDVVAGRLKVTGLTHSIAQSMCTENWTYTSWSTCSSSSQSRNVNDTNACGTTLERPATTQSCSSSTTTTTTTTTTSNGGGTTDDVSDRISLIAGNFLVGETRAISIASDEIGIQQIEITTKENAYGVKIVVEKLASKPSSVSDAPAGKVYKYLKFDNQNLPDSAIEEAKIKFKVDRSWLDANGIKTGDVVLVRHDGSKWEDLPTTVSKSEQSVVTFEAVTTGFSYFAIRANYEEGAGEAEAAPSTTAEEAAGEMTGGATANATGEEAIDIEKEGKWNIPWMKVGIGVLIALVVALIAIGGYYFFKVRREKSNLMKVKIKPKK